MIVHARHQHRARRRAERRGIEVRHAQAVFREAVEIRRVDFAAERADVRVAEIVGDDQQHVRALVGGMGAGCHEHGRCDRACADEVLHGVSVNVVLV